jgi:uncharacterized membrane protein YphA (DoxX/SURF4 family)
MNQYFLLAVRLVLGTIWIYQGCFLKIIMRDAHEFFIVRSLGLDDAGAWFWVIAIGVAEVWLGLGIISGIAYRTVNIFQIVILLLMNVVGICFGNGSIEHPFGLLLSNCPHFLLAWLLVVHGPGRFAMSSSRRRLASGNSATA